VIVNSDTTAVIDKSKPQKITSATARNRRTGHVEHYRCRDTRASREDVLARFGCFLATLGWKPADVLIVNVITEVEDNVTQSIRNRMVKPR